LRFTVPCNAHWLRSRCPGRPASGPSRFGVSIPVGPRAFCSRRPADRMIFFLALAVFRWSGFLAMKLAWRTLGGRGVFQSNPSLARRVSPMSSVASVSAGRRSVAPTATSSIARAGEIGETDPPGPVSQDLSRHLASRHTGRRRFTASVVTLARDPCHSSAFAKTPPPATGHSPYRAFFAWRSATRFEPCTAWPDDAGLPFSLSSSSDGAPGVLPRPSQV